MSSVTSDKSGRNNTETKTEAVHSTLETELSADTEITPSVSDTDGLNDDVVFELLKESRRRKVLEYLEITDGEVTIGELAEYIAAEENQTEVAQISSDQRKRVYVGLYQCHLPKLNESNVIDYNRSRGVIKLSSNADKLLNYMDFKPEKTSQSESGVLARLLDEIPLLTRLRW